MLPIRHLGYSLVVLGVILIFTTFFLSGGTQRACEFDSIIYNTTGIHPTESTVIQLDLTNAEIEWHDGCNRRNGSLITLLLGLTGVGTGTAIVIGWTRFSK